MTEVFKYPPMSLIGSYARAVFGILLTVVPLLLLNPISVILYLLVFLLFLFLGYGLRTIFRQFTRFNVTEDGIFMIGPVSRTITWEELDGFTLKYFSTRRDREAGWMNLKLKGGRVTLNIDSTIHDFHKLLRLIFRAAERKGLRIEPTTLSNLLALGILPSPPESRAGKRDPA